MDTSKVNRLEVIDHRAASEGTDKYGRTVIVAGPAYGKPDNAKIELAFQDNGRTLKVFIQDKPNEE